jgi:preprotein translocase subunit YajC
MIAIVLIAIAVLFIWLALVRPQKRQQRVQAEMWEALGEGDEVVTAGGIYGDVTGFEGDDVLIRIAPELEVRVARRAIAGVIRSAGDEDDDEDEDELAEDSIAESGSYSEDSR